MSDLISRQAAIDAINHICPVDTEYDCILLDRVDVRYVLSELPSAQPEIVRCEDCKKRGTDNCDIDFWLYRQSYSWYCASGERKSNEVD